MQQINSNKLHYAFIQYFLKEQGKAFIHGPCNTFTVLLQINRVLCHWASMHSDNCKILQNLKHSILKQLNTNRLSGRKGTAGS